VNHRVTVAPVRVGIDRADLHVRSLRGVGYRAVCSCEWRSPVRGSFTQARHEGYYHRAQVADTVAVVPEAGGHDAATSLPG
jgi:hypothetical protein